MCAHLFMYYESLVIGHCKILNMQDTLQDTKYAKKSVSFSFVIKENNTFILMIAPFHSTTVAFSSLSRFVHVMPHVNEYGNLIPRFTVHTNRTFRM